MADEQTAIAAEERTREMTNSGTKEVAETHRFDESRLADWMKANDKWLVKTHNIDHWSRAQTANTSIA